MSQEPVRQRRARPLPEPRTWLRGEADRFGKTRAPTWAEPGDDWERVAINAARLQHDIVSVVDELRREQRLTWGAIAAGLETLSEVQLTKVARGQAPMSFAHAADLTRRFGALLMGGAPLRRVLEENRRMRRQAG